MASNVSYNKSTLFSLLEITHWPKDWLYIPPQGREEWGDVEQAVVLSKGWTISYIESGKTNVRQSDLRAELASLLSCYQHHRS